MKIRHSILLIVTLFLLSACNFTLAQDVTPPPDYVPPTPMPTLGPLYPANAPDVANGGTIYAQKCAACHGSAGMGDGPQGKDLPVKVAAIGLPAIAQKALPSDWYTKVTQGDLDRFMPPFASLSDQERWDVVAYALTLHTTPAQVEDGKSLFAANCADCAKYFNNQKMMSALSENDIVQTVKQGAGDIPAFGSKFTDDQAAAVAVYIRTLTFATPAAPTVDSATQAAATPSAETTPLAADGGTAQANVTPGATTVASMGKVSGSIDNKSGADLPSDIKVTLHAYDHGGDMNAGPKEVATLEGAANADGTFAFENVEIPDSRIFIAEVKINGLTYKSEFAIAKAGATDLSLKPIVVYPISEDFSVLKIESLQIFFDLANADSAQVFEIYTITNASDKTVMVKMTDTNVPFIVSPTGAKGLGYEATQDSAPFMQVDNGFAMPPSDKPYGLIAYSSVPNVKEIAIAQKALMPIGSVSLFIPEGVKVKGNGLTADGTQAMGQQNFQVYTASGLDKDKSIDFTLSGAPKNTAVNPDITQNKNLLIGIGALGVVLILAGAWMFMRDRRKHDKEAVEEEEDEFGDPESLMDAIIALDDLHRAGKIPNEAYQQRRSELKDALKRRK